MTRKNDDRGKPPRGAAPPVAGADARHHGERIAKVMARAGLCSRRDAEEWIAAGPVAVNRKPLSTPAANAGGRGRPPNPRKTQPRRRPPPPLPPHKTAP